MRKITLPHVRLFYATDLHASERCYRKFLNAAKVYDVNVLILGGDITGKMVIPIVQSRNTWKTKFMGVDTEVKSNTELSDLVTSIRNTGYYPHICSADEMESLNTSEEAIRDLFMRLMLDQVTSWIKLAEERLAFSGTKMFITGGNDDPIEIEPVLNSSGVIVNPENKVVELGLGVEMVSCGYGNITPWKCPRDLEEEVLLQKIENVASQLTNPLKAVFNLHVPPYDSGLDDAPQLDKNLKPVATPGVGLTMVPVGSKAVRTVIEKYQPMLGLHGHIHESRGSTKIGRTLCINPGSEYGESVLRGVIVDFDEKGIKSHVMTAG
jgi:Icc-related predicted phosphoesterase